MTIRVEEYLRADGSSPFRRWAEALPADARQKIWRAIARLEGGNTSNVKWFRGIGELRIHFGPGYRVYLLQDGVALILLLGGGTKKRQQRGITAALWLRAEYHHMKQKE